MTISVKINLSKIDKTKIFQGKDGKYIDIVLIEKKNQYGDWMAVQGQSKADREAGHKSPILGNGKNFGGSPTQSSQQAPPAATASNDFVSGDDLPF